MKNIIYWIKKVGDSKVNIYLKNVVTWEKYWPWKYIENPDWGFWRVEFDVPINLPVGSSVVVDQDPSIALSHNVDTDGIS